MDEPSPTHIDILRYASGRLEQARDELAREEPLEIRVRGRAISVTMRTPGHDEELAVGFLLSEGLIRHRQDVLRVEPCPRSEAGNRVDVILAPDVTIDFDRLTRHVFASSSCGLCGKATIDAIHNTFPPVTSNLTIQPSVLAQLPEVMRAAQTTFSRTGGLHAAALFDPEGRMMVLREDIGRHNAVDKALGFAFFNDSIPLDRHVLLVSGRASFEIMQKALAGGVPVVAAVSAPSSLAAQFANASGQTLVGFLRSGRMNVYSHPKRIDFGKMGSQQDHAINIL